MAPQRLARRCCRRDGRPRGHGGHRRHPPRRPRPGQAHGHDRTLQAPRKPQAPRAPQSRGRARSHVCRGALRSPSRRLRRARFLHPTLTAGPGRGDRPPFRTPRLVATPPRPPFVDRSSCRRTQRQDGLRRGKWLGTILARDGVPRRSRSTDRQRPGPDEHAWPHALLGRAGDLAGRPLRPRRPYGKRRDRSTRALG